MEEELKTFPILMDSIQVELSSLMVEAKSFLQNQKLNIHPNKLEIETVSKLLEDYDRLTVSLPEGENLKEKV